MNVLFIVYLIGGGVLYREVLHGWFIDIFYWFNRTVHSTAYHADIDLGSLDLEGLAYAFQNSEIPSVVFAVIFASLLSVKTVRYSPVK